MASPSCATYPSTLSRFSEPLQPLCPWNPVWDVPPNRRQTDKSILASYKYALENTTRNRGLYPYTKPLPSAVLGKGPSVNFSSVKGSLSRAFYQAFCRVSPEPSAKKSYRDGDFVNDFAECLREPLTKKSLEGKKIFAECRALSSAALGKEALYLGKTYDTRQSFGFL